MSYVVCRVVYGICCMLACCMLHDVCFPSYAVSCMLYADCVCMLVAGLMYDVWCMVYGVCCVLCFVSRSSVCCMVYVVCCMDVWLYAVWCMLFVVVVRCIQHSVRAPKPFNIAHAFL